LKYLPGRCLLSIQKMTSIAETKLFSTSSTPLLRIDPALNPINFGTDKKELADKTAKQVK
jgi:hypothetical protein